MTRAPLPKPSAFAGSAFKLIPMPSLLVHPLAHVPVDPNPGLLGVAKAVMAVCKNVDLNRNQEDADNAENHSRR